MQLEYLGNGFDHMKDAVLGELHQRGLLQDLVVDPMARPALRWTDEHFEQYARILRLDESGQIAKHNVQWGAGKRESYFAELNGHSGRDFFLDPDTGVATSKAKPKHIKPSEVVGLLQDQNVVAVYQHGAGGQIRHRVQTVVQALQRCLPSIECLAYMEPRASMLFLAKQPHRLRDIEACLDCPRLGGSLEWFVPNRRFLTHVKLKNYKSIAATDVRLSQVSLLVGPNGSGKSNFLDALRFVTDALNTSLDQALRVRGGVDLVQRKPRDDMEPFGLRLQFELEASWLVCADHSCKGQGWIRDLSRGMSPHRKGRKEKHSQTLLSGGVRASGRRIDLEGTASSGGPPLLGDRIRIRRVPARV